MTPASNARDLRSRIAIRCAAPSAAWLVFGLASCAGTREVQPAQEGMPMGRLGAPLGTFLKIEGIRETSGKVGDRTLRVDRVDGKDLATPQWIDLEDLTLPKGERCVVRGFESGKWIGVPQDIERREQLPPRQAPWQFYKYFVVTSVKSPAGLAAQIGPKVQ